MPPPEPPKETALEQFSFNAWDIKLEIEEHVLSGVLLSPPDYGAVGEDWNVVCRTSGQSEASSIRDFACEFCNGCFENSDSLTKHKLEHLQLRLNQAKIHRCDICKAIFLTTKAIKAHILRKHGRENAVANPHQIKATASQRTCGLCNKVYKYKAWHEHMSNVHNSEKCECKLCGKVFKCLRYLKNHERYTHNQYKRYEEVSKTCDVCSKSFKNQGCLYQHVKNVHAIGESKFECSICLSVLKTKSYLTAHVRRVHYDDGERHPCDICGKSFKSPRYLSVHKRYNHGSGRTSGGKKIPES